MTTGAWTLGRSGLPTIEIETRTPDWAGAPFRRPVEGSIEPSERTAMYDLVVLGAGSGGLQLASEAAAVGANVLLIEKEAIGGEHTHSACVPSKALLHAAELAERIRSAERYGLHAQGPEVDFRSVMGRIREVVGTFEAIEGPRALEAQGIEVRLGAARFEAYDTVRVDGGEPIVSKRFVIATGSRPRVPAIEGLEAAGYLTNETFWQLEDQPKSLLILGAGSSGVEFAQAMARLGTRVTLFETGPRILPEEDPEAADLLHARLAAEGIAVETQANLQRVEVQNGRRILRWFSNRENTTFEHEADELLITTGRLANVEDLGLEAVGIRTDAERGIPVDDDLRTYVRNIYAIGDVIGHHQWTHAAELEASVAFQNAVLGLPKTIDYTALPWVTFTDPEVATVGQLRDFPPGREVLIDRATFDGLDRARIEGRTAGFAKVASTPSGKILGATVVGENAAIVLQEFVLAMKHGLTLTDLAETTHPYPTHSGLVRAIAQQRRRSRLGSGLVGAVLRLFYGFRPRLGSSSKNHH